MFLGAYVIFPLFYLCYERWYGFLENTVQNIMFYLCASIAQISLLAYPLYPFPRLHNAIRDLIVSV